ncbi:MAG: hypothetical protein IIY78_00870 [Clostridia bacterium]|nr:hypothetical protein [Clostridia bacterium]
MMNDNMNNKDGVTQDFNIDLVLLFGILRKNIVLLIVVGLIGGGLAYSVTRYLIPEKYKATATVIINNKATDSQYIYPSEIKSSQDLAELYSIIIKADSVLEQVRDSMGIDISNEDLKRSIDVNMVGETQVVQISCVSTNPDYALDLVTQFVYYSKPMIREKVEAGSVKDLNEPALSNNGRPISPNRRKNTIIGIVAGVLFSGMIVVMKELLNTTFKTEADITNTLGIPVLGVIPYVERKEFGVK